ncbi:hypothetical protein N7457_002287 [Penicillium paradoxum]|uniref:uncharacterized protein n=1 Tax=Penicillium paradoxum TaxID=176176 RepID=UPI0025473D02|nr:uncharacterized protein N7457_002287 [Penicillium paradoxum]KAJ5787297.1 hypothetical protein N7457_002287 [Penicillium paradoxum]
MPPSESIIRALPSDVIARIESSTSIVHLTGVILELVKNSLDAKARTVSINVDFKRGGCIVEDDGDGIAPSERAGQASPHVSQPQDHPDMRLLTYALDTSKFNSTGLYGHRGSFLASLASLSLLTVVSRHIRHENTNSIIFHHSTPVARLIPAPAQQVLRSPEHGTSVTVNDLFGNMPVRVKRRALTLQRSEDLEREWENLRNSLVSLLLANPQVSKLIIVDVEKHKRISIRPGSSSTLEECIQNPSGFDLNRIRSIFMQSGLIPRKDFEFWHEMSASVRGLTVQAAISLQPSPTRRSQFISLGKEPVISRNASNVLYNEVNRLFALSDFGSTARPLSCRSSDTNIASSANQHASVTRRDTESNTSTRSWIRPVNKWPMFYIRIDTKSAIRLDDGGSEYLPESEKSIQRIVDVLGAMIVEFLKQHSLRPRDGKQKSLSSNRIQTTRSNKVSLEGGSSRGPLKQSLSASSTDETFGSYIKMPSFPKSYSLNSGHSFTNWSRTKSAHHLNMSPPAQRTPHSGPAFENVRRKTSFPTTSAEGPTGSNQNREVTTLSQPLRQGLSGKDGKKPVGLPDDSSSDKMITWIDPRTRLAYTINPRTGQTMNSRKSLATQRSRTDFDHASLEHPSPGFWVDNMLEEWENPVFGRTEIPIPGLGTEFVGQHIANTSMHDCFRGIGSLNTAQVAKYRGKLRRHALESAEVIAQVDQKFILAKVHSTAVQLNWDGASNHVLLLIDQHAADERCRLEQLFSEMFLSPEVNENLKSHCRVQTVRVDSLIFQVSSTEGGLFQKHQEFFSVWGIGYGNNITTNSTATITVHTLPLLIAERCRLEPHVLLDLMRREIWSSEEEGRAPFQAKKAFETGDNNWGLDLSDNEDSVPQETTRTPASRAWVQQMKGCPQGILDLLNSRACRTAIMFNDSLNTEECQALVSRLARCAFPFQCAHGRPSMVPILDLRSLPETDVTLPLDLNGRASTHDYDDTMNLDFLDAFRRKYVTQSD